MRVASEEALPDPDVDPHAATQARWLTEFIVRPEKRTQEWRDVVGGTYRLRLGPGTGGSASPHVSESPLRDSDGSTRVGGAS